MGALMRGHDWAATPVGPSQGWPQTLKTTVRLMLTSRHPMFIWWGEALTCFYNDAYSGTIGPDRHPSALGRPGREVWAEIWDVIGPEIELVMSGRAPPGTSGSSSPSPAATLARTYGGPTATRLSTTTTRRRASAACW